MVKDNEKIFEPEIQDSKMDSNYEILDNIIRVKYKRASRNYKFYNSESKTKTYY